MEYIQSISSQTMLFFLSLGFGFLLGVLYDVFRIVRKLAPKAKYFVFVIDFLYFMVCGILAFFFLLAVDEGRLRFYTLSGEILGWIIYYFSFGAISLKVTNSVAGFLRLMFAVLISPVKFFLRKINNVRTKIKIF